MILVPMDKSQFQTLVITTAVTTAVTTIVALSIKWFFAFAKERAASETTKQNVRKIFNKTNILIAWDVGWTAWMTLLLVRIMRETTPVRRIDVLVIVGLVLAIVFTLLSIAFIAGSIIGRRSTEKLLASIDSASRDSSAV